MAPANGTSATTTGDVLRDELNNNNNNNNNISSVLNKNNSTSYDHDDDLCYDSDNQTTTNSKTNNNNNNNDNDSSSNEKTNLIVNYLPQPMTDAEFTKLFEKYGTIKTAKIVRHKVTGYSYGFGFVDFQNNNEAISAIEGLNGHELDNKKIKVAFARPAGQDIKQANLYVKNVPNIWNQDDVRKLFEPYGDIIQCRVLGNSRGVAFVLFNLRKQAEDALKALKGTTVPGGDNPLEIKFAADNAQKSGNIRSGNSSGNNNNVNANKSHHGSNDRLSNNNRMTQNQPRNKASAFASPYQRPQPQLMQQNFYQANDHYSQPQPFESYMRHQPGLRVQSQYAVPYGGSLQTNQGYLDGYNTYTTTPIGSPGPIRQPPTVRQNRYAPFTPQQTQMPTVQLQQASQGYQYPDQRLVNNLYSQPQQQQLMPPIETQTPVPLSGINMFSGTQSTASLPQVMNSQFMGQSRTPIAPTMGHHPASYSHQPTNVSLISMNSNHSNQNTVNLSGGGNADGVTLFVYNIGSDGDEDLLKELFSSYGPVLKCNVVRKSPSQECKGYGFVTLPDQKLATAAIQNMNGYKHKNGKALQVSLKK